MTGSVWAFSRALSSIKTRLISKELANICVPFSAVRCFSVTQARNMKLVQFTYNTKPDEVRAGYMEGDDVVDLNKADGSLPLKLVDILKLDCAVERIAQIKAKKPQGVPLSGVRLEAPITNQDKVIGVGLNYLDHCKEQNLTPPEVPMIFSKFSSVIIGPNDAVKLRTEITQSVDWEVELAVVIGKECTMIDAKDAYNYVLGYTVAQDISARDWQKKKNSGQFILGKSMDTFCPIGPWIVTADEIKDPQCLDIKCTLNGVVKQNSNTCQLIHKIPDVIARLASVMTLYPGDIILSGTPGGVGMHRNPPEFLKPGDKLISEIQSIGTLETRVVKFDQCGCK
ncbi:fumarylacetoacetate hydrolase domain-containing protein 2 isoform X1 [Ostrinia furnacalis]|uniref:fumarylacetoacetate hydrolase domain-containing protein 2 isoform X1 n=2 Tax=Ostrinia furnacalis TaxID=93504 RepID=UPI00103C04BE|nr:fumarylacetoacetate hydrolase domain-containing protein 2 isoform X1 [Ostrinia furnacalis]